MWRGTGGFRGRHRPKGTIRRIDPELPDLPDFLVIGAPKAGTTSLSAGLASHPQVWIPYRKEMSYFDIRWRREPIERYAADFADAPAGTFRGEATPTYLHVPGAMGRIAEVLPAVRLVAILRDPVERAWSHYWYNRAARLVEDRPPREAFAEDPDEYLRPGEYGANLRGVLDHFDREQLHVLTLDELKTDAAGAFQRICRHLGVDEHGVSDRDARNQAYTVRWPRLRQEMRRFRLWKRLPFRLGFRLEELNRVPIEVPDVPGDLRRELAEHYADDTDDLARLLGRAVPWGPQAAAPPQERP